MATKKTTPAKRVAAKKTPAKKTATKRVESEVKTPKEIATERGEPWGVLPWKQFWKNRKY